MTTPERYVDWSMRADPQCGICRGMGYARYRQNDGLSAGERILRGLPEPTGTYESGCECLARPQSEVARERMAQWVPPPP